MSHQGTVIFGKIRFPFFTFNTALNKRAFYLKEIVNYLYPHFKFTFLQIMKKNRFAFFCLGILFTGFSASAQTLFSYGHHPVSEQEFLTVYDKNNKGADAKNTSLSDYLNLYALYRMKVQEALDMRMDTTEAVINELNNYKSQLTRSELLDKEVTDRLVQEAYGRMKTDINVSHILIAVHPGQDSAIAKKRIDSLYAVLKQGKADFATLAQKYSDDQTTAKEGGNIGYITALQTPYDFETTAYTTPKGTISQPFRTIYGYDILKVNAIRPDPGKVQVAQILIASPSYKGEAAREAALKLADSLETQLKKGVSFDELVKKYSDDKFTRDNNGIMAPFGIGKMALNYEKAAFALQRPGDISEPVETEYGYHILKLIRKIPLQPLDSIRFELTSKVKNDSREAAAQAVYMDKVKEKYHFKDYPDYFVQLVNVVKQDTNKSFNPKRYPLLDKPLFELDGKTYYQADFLRYADKITKENYIGSKATVLKDLYSGYQNKMVSNLQQQKLLEGNPHLQSLIREYKNGVLLFDLMDKKVWNKATTDTVGLRAYYEKNKDKYVWQPGFEGSVFYSDNQAALQKLQGFLNEGEDAEVALDKANDAMKDKNEITSQSGRYAFDQFPIAGSSLQKSKPSAVFEIKGQGTTFGLIQPNTLYPTAEAKTLDDARGFIVADYQDYLEKQWEKQLKEKYPLKVNEKILKRLESQHH